MVNKWTEKSIKIANAPGYLDNLANVYVMQMNPERPLSDDIVPQVKEAFEKKNSKGLIKLLIENAEVFPVKDSYVGFLKAKPSAIDENPITIERIAQRLYSYGSFNAVLREAQRPKETNRQLGHSFKTWLKAQGYEYVSSYDMKQSKEGIKVLEGSDTQLASFAAKEMKMKSGKGRDFVIKVDTQYIVGEAKFLTTPGGEQTGGFNDAYSFVTGSGGNAIRVAVIDGYVWLPTSDKYTRMINANKNIMSVLVLNDFLKSIKKIS